MNINAAIIIPSGRPKLLKKTLSSFYKNWNNKYQYPIYIHTLGEVYSEEEKKFFIKKYKNISFEIVNPKLPKHIKKKDLFFNRFYNKYAFNSFTARRLGYLHICYFVSNVASFGKAGCLSKKLEQYDYIMRIDDDAWFRKKINFDMFKRCGKHPQATGRLTISGSRKIPLTREKLFYFLQKYIKTNNINVINNKLKLVLNSNDENNFSQLPYSLGNFEIYNMKVFKSPKFKRYISSVNKFGGQYKYRWADYDLTNLFLYMFYKNPILSFKFSEETYKSSHPNAKKVYDSDGLFSNLIFYITKRIKFLFYKININ
tara:strand:- start:665 stop:1606 length:942 start_codon:yes stop_codon:yes gene_type:complete